MTPQIEAEKAKRERQVGRALDAEEYLFLTTDRQGVSAKRRPPDPRDPLKQMADAKWRPVMAAAPDATDYSAELAQVEAEIAASAEFQQFASLDAKGQYAAVLRKKHADELANRKAERATREHLAANAATIARLTALQDEIRWSDEYDLSAVAAVGRALQQISTVGGDPATAAKLVAEAFGCKAAIVKAKAAKIAEQRAQLDKVATQLLRQIDELDASAADPLEALYEAYRANPGDADAEYAYWSSKAEAEGRPVSDYVAPRGA